MAKRVLALMVALVAFFSFASGADAAAKVKAYYYYGIGCGFCEKLKPWLHDFETARSEELDLERYEVFQDKQNYKSFSNVMRMYGVPKNDQGTPTLIINNKVLIGYDEIRNKAEGEFAEAKKRIAETEPAKDETPKQNPAEKGDDYSFAAIFFAAAADSVNPCAMMVLIILMASLMTYQKKDIVNIATTAISFIGAVFVTYFILGLGISNIISSSGMAVQMSRFVAALAIVVGLGNLKDAFFYRKGGWAMEIPEAWRARLTEIVTKATSPLGAFVAGAIVTMFELPCTGGPYLFGLSLMAERPDMIERIGLLLFYNIVFVAPLAAVAILCVRGMCAIEKAEDFRNKHIKLVHGFTGIVMLLGGIWLLAR